MLTRISKRVLTLTSVRAGRFFVLSFLALFSVAASAGDANSEDPVFLLQAMQQAAVETNYRGTFIFSRGEMSSTVEVVHRYRDGIEEERLKQLDGEMGEVIRRGREVMCVLPDNKVVKIEQDAISSGVVQAFSGFRPKHELYTLRFVGATRLIDREALNIAVEAQDKHRYSYQLWLDKDTKLLLKSSLQGNGVELERFRYAEIEFTDAITDLELNPMNEGPVISHQLIPSAKKDHKWPGGIAWQVGWAPPGYEAMGVSNNPGKNVMLYSDGLATFSVFVEQIESNSMPIGASVVGATVAYHHRVLEGSHHYGVTVMGEVPAMTAMMVAESVRPTMTSDTK